MDLDPRCKALNILSGFNEIHKGDISLSRWRKLQKRILLFIESDDETVHTGLLTKPFLLLDEEIFKIASKYEPLMPGRQVVLLDKENHISCLYYLPILPRISCISPNSKLSNANTKFVGTPILQSNKMLGIHIFWLDGFNSDLPVISLDLAESILRRNHMGIKLTPIEIE